MIMLIDLEFVVQLIDLLVLLNETGQSHHLLHKQLIESLAYTLQDLDESPELGLLLFGSD